MGTHPLLAEFLRHADESPASSMRASVLDAALELSSTFAGAEVMCRCLGHGTAKERKVIVKQCKGRALSIGLHPCGYIVLMRILQVVDDTTLVRKCVLKELADDAEAMPQLLTSDSGAR